MFDLDVLGLPDSNSTLIKGRKSKRQKKKPKPLEHAKVLLLTEQQCYIAALNRIYQSPPLETTTLDCIAANRRLPCSLCATRNNIHLDFPTPPLPHGIELPQSERRCEVATGVSVPACDE